jgi:hypothetical protein
LHSSFFIWFSFFSFLSHRVHWKGEEGWYWWGLLKVTPRRPGPVTWVTKSLSSGVVKSTW